jgi:hypothetical protein
MINVVVSMFTLVMAERSCVLPPPADDQRRDSAPRGQDHARSDRCRLAAAPGRCLFSFARPVEGTSALREGFSSGADQ